MIKLLLILIVFFISSCDDKEKYTVCWIEKSEEGGKGEFRHNGILTDSGYVFSDTIWSHELKKEMVLTTRVMIHKSN